MERTPKCSPRRAFLGCAALGAVCAMTMPALAVTAARPAAAAGNPLDVLTAINTRRSVRAYGPQPVSDKELDTVLAAAMMAPSAANEQPWDFVVIRDPATLAGVGAINRYASFAAKAPAAILVCLNTEKEKEKGMGILDVAMSAQNLLLAAHGIGLGAVFTGIYPVEERMRGFRKLLGLPESVVPVGLIVLGHPAVPGLRTAEDRINPASVHREKWQGAGK